MRTPDPDPIRSSPSPAAPGAGAPPSSPDGAGGARRDPLGPGQRPADAAAAPGAANPTVAPEPVPAGAGDDAPSAGTGSPGAPGTPGDESPFGRDRAHPPAGAEPEDRAATAATEGAGAAPAPPESADAAAAPEGDQVEHDLDELLAKARERDEYLSLAQRTQADFENYRRRVSRDAALAESRGVGKVVRELLPALDNLARAIQTAQEPSGDAELMRGIRLVQSELSAALARVGVQAYSPEGELFDPQHHEAMMQQPVEGATPGTIVQVFQPGYRLGDVILRPARVVVAA